MIYPTLRAWLIAIYLVSMSLTSVLHAAPTTISINATITILEDTPTSVNFTLADADSPTGAGITVTGAAGTHPASPGFVFPADNDNNRSVVITSGSGLSGNGNVTLTAGDGTGANTTKQFYLKVLSVNDAPTFTLAGNVTGTAATAFTQANYATAVNANDTGQTVSFALSNNNTALFSVQPQLTGSGATRTLIFTPRAGAGGSASVTVTGEDTGNTANGGVTQTTGSFLITVDGVNRAPSITPPTTQTTDEDVATGPIAFSVSDPDDGSGNSLTVTVTGSSDTDIIPIGNVTLGGSGTSRTVNVIGATNQIGNVTITLQVSDGTLTDSDSFVVRILAANDAPTITIGANQLVQADVGAQTVAGFATADPGFGESGQTVIFLVSNNNTSAFTSTGQPKINASGTLTYTPNVSAPDSTVQVTVIGQDNGNPAAQSAASTFSITIEAVNRPPTIPSGPSTTDVDEDSSVGPLAITLSDLDDPTGASLTLTAASSNTTIIPNGGLELGGSGNDREITITPADDQFGDVTVTLTVTDPDSATAMRTFLVHVLSVNDEPSFALPASPDRTVAGNAGPQSELNFATSIDRGAANESGQGVSFTVSNNNASIFAAQPAISATGTLTFTPNASQAITGSALVSVFMKDNGGTANDGDDTSPTQTFTITVTAVNQPPQIATLPPTTDIDEDGSSGELTITLSDVNDPSGTTLTLTAVSGNSGVIPNSTTNIVLGGSGNNRTIALTPASDQFGDAVITLTATDAMGATDVRSFTVHVLAVNDEPSFNLPASPNRTVAGDAGAQSENNFATNIDRGADNESAQGVSFSVGNNNPTLFSAQPAISPTGTLTFVPNGAQTTNGTALVTVFLTDNGGTSNGGDDTSPSQTFNITITAVNQPPQITAVPPATDVDEDGSSGALGITLSDVNDPSGTTLTLTAVSGNSGVIPNSPSNILLLGSGNSRTVSVTPAADQFGDVVITLTVTDPSGSTDMETFTVHVLSVNDEPSFDLPASPNRTVAADAGAQSESNFATNIDRGAANESGQTVTFTVSNNNTSIFSVQPAIGATGTLTFTPNPALPTNATATVTVSLTDNGSTANGGDDTSPSQTFNITITGVNQPPIFNTVPSDTTINEDASTAGLNVTFADANDATGTSLTVTASSSDTAIVPNSPVNLFLGGSGNSRTLTITPADDAFGDVVITLTVTDPSSATDTHTFTLTVLPVNDEPSFNLVASPNRTVSAGVSAQSEPNFATNINRGAANESGQTVSFAVSNNNTAIFSAQPAISPIGTLTFTPASSLPSTSVATVSVVLSDNGGTANGGDDTTAAQTFTITVTGGGGNQAPLVSITSPNHGDSFLPPFNGPVTADATDNDGTVTQVEFFAKRHALINVNFTSHLSPGHVTKTGAAATGEAGDYWNTYSRDVGSPLNNLKYADGVTESGVDLQVSNAGEFGVNVVADDMFKTYLYPSTPGSSITLTVNNLPPGQYEFYFYAHGSADNQNAEFELIGAGNHFSGLATTTFPDWDDPAWQDVRQYVRYLPVTNGSFGSTITITVDPKDSTMAPINGMQIHRLNFPTGTTSLGVDTTSTYSRPASLGAGVYTLYGVATDDDGATTTSDSIRITVLPGNSAPTDILLSSSTIAENSIYGATVGTLSAVDPDPGDTHTFALVSGTGDTDNGSFNVSPGGTLTTAEVFDFETKNSYSIRVRATDQPLNGLTVDKVFTITVTDVADGGGPIFLTQVSDVYPDSPFLTCEIGIFEEPSNTHHWKVLSRSTGPQRLWIAASCVNASENGAIEATITDNLGVQNIIVVHPNAEGVSSVGVLDVTLTANQIYSLTIERVLPVSGPEAHHYKLGASSKTVELSWKDPLRYLEGHEQAWQVNTDPNEDVSIDVFTDAAGPGVPTQATNITLNVVTAPAFGPPVVASTTFPLPGTITIPNHTGGALVINIESVDGHFRMKKNSGSDKGFYALPCPPHCVDRTIDFDTVDTSTAPATGGKVEAYLAQFGISVADVTPPFTSQLTIYDDAQLYAGAAAESPSQPNLLTQAGSNDPVSYTLRFSHPLDAVRFKRAKLIAATPSGITHPSWQAVARDENNNIVAQVSEGVTASFSDVPAAQFELTGATTIVSLQISSQNSGTAFNAMLLDDLELVCPEEAPSTGTAIYQEGTPDPFVEGTYNGVEDAMIMHNGIFTTVNGNPVGHSSSENFGARGDMEVSVAQVVGYSPRRSLVRFNLSSLAGQFSSISSVTLRLTTSGASENAGTIELFRLSDANAGWVEGSGFSANGYSQFDGENDGGGATWNYMVQAPEPDQFAGTLWAGGAAAGPPNQYNGAGTPGTDYGPALASVPFSGVASGTQVDFVITDQPTINNLINGWISGPNTGFFLKLVQDVPGASGIHRMFFHTSESPTVAARPQLIINYMVEDELGYLLPDANTVALYRFDEASGATAMDSSPGGNFPGTLQNGASRTSAETGFGTALSLDGTDDYASIDSGLLNSRPQGTLEATVYLDSYGPWFAPIVSKGSTTLTDFDFGVGSDGKLSAHMGTSLYFAGSNVVPLNTWVRLAFTWDGSSWKFYINGVLDAQVAATESPLTSSNPVQLGRHNHSAGPFYFSGRMDEVRFSSIARTFAPTPPPP